MNDLISRNAAIEAITNYAKFLWDNYHETCHLAGMIDTIDALPTAEPRWIPVTEGLPEEDTDVLISYRYKEGEGDTSHVYIDITSYGDMYFGGRKVKGAKHWRPPFEYFTSNYEVIAWMPLPKPWKEKKDDT